MKTCLIYISRSNNSICFDWREKIIITSLNNTHLCETAIQSLPFLFYKKKSQNMSTLFETIKHFDETTNVVFIKNFRILMCAMYGKTIIQNNKITFQEELFCVNCDQNKIKSNLQICSIDDNNYNKSLNEFWKTLLQSFLNNLNVVIKCEVIKNIPMILNHFHPESSFRNQMLMLINDNDEEVRIQCSNILNFIIFEKDSIGNIQTVETYFAQMLNILCSTVNTSLKFGNHELQYTCLETIFNIGW